MSDSVRPSERIRKNMENSESKRKVKIITDSCSDLTTELMERYDIDYARMNTVRGGVVSPALLSWSDEEVHEFYEAMRSGCRITTTQVPVDEFHSLFEKYINEGCDIVYIGCSTKQSGSVNTAHVVAKKLMDEHPEASIFSIDSLNACIGEGMLAIEAAKLSRQGLCADEIADRITKMRKNVNEYCTVHSLDALRRAGRVKGSAAFFGNLMGVKPIIIADLEGAQAAYKKVKGRQNSLCEIVSLLKESIIDPEEQTIYVAHSDCKEEEYTRVCELIKSEIGCKEVYTCYIGPIIGASVGPDAIGVFGFGKSVTFNAEV